MSAHPHNRGGAAVGFITELDGVEAASVIYLRLWSDGADARAQVRDDFITALGHHQGEKAVQSFDSICALCATHGRRPLMRHAVQCKCLGADESCFANFIATASEGAREDTMLIATLLVRADVAPLLASCAFDFGLALKRMRLGAPRDYAAVLGQPTTLH
ncbi:hypothetical protein ABMC88_10310 [Sulfitobacter sp. HNIBRBA2951]|uniref:hypothetical protein n=1 Tax=Sulfitobacter aquimarinus TaxID=3158557 RepID=UPI0032DEAA0E